MAKIGDGVKLWIGSGKNCGVRNRSQRGLRESFLEHHTLAGHSVQIRRKPELIAEESHAVSAGGVDRYENDIGSFRPRHSAEELEDEKKEKKMPHGKQKGSLPSVNSRR